MDDGNSVATKLLTLLNVSATKIGKRKRVDEFVHSKKKLNKRKPLDTSVVLTQDENISAAHIPTDEDYLLKEQKNAVEVEEDGILDSYFGSII